MGDRRLPSLLLLAALAAACGEQGQERELATGPEFKPSPPPTGCDFTGLPTLIRSYFPGPRQTAIVNIADLMAAAGQHSSGARDHGFEIMDSVGYLSRDNSVTTDPAAGATLTIGLIKCMFADWEDFAYPSTAQADLTLALMKVPGGAYFVRGGTTSRNGTNGDTPVIGADWSNPGNPDNLSGVRPPAGDTWTSILDTEVNDSISEGRALIFGYLVTTTPTLTYEWVTVPSDIEFDPGAVVSVCDGSDGSNTAMVHESSIGVLAFVEDNTCGEDASTILVRADGGPRALASRLARVVVNALSPQPLQAATTALAKSGSGGTATTFKSRVKTTSVEAVDLSFAIKPPSTLKVNVDTYTVVVRATTTVDGEKQGVNGVCIYLTGSNNNGFNTDLKGDGDAGGCALPEQGDLVSKTKSGNFTGELLAGYAEFNVGVNKTGGLILTASSTNGKTTGVFDREGQTFTEASVKVNVKP